MNKVKINQGRIVPLQFRIVVTALTLGFIAAAMLHLPELPAIMVSIALSFLIPLVWSSHYVLEIDPEEKTISESQWVMSWKIKKPKTYSDIDHIFINETRQAQQMTSWGGQVRTSRIREYAAFLKFSSGEKYFLISHTNPARLHEKLKTIQQKLGCKVINNY